MAMRLPTFRHLSIRRLMTLWAAGSLIALLVIGTSSVVSNHFVFLEHQRLTRTALPIETASAALNRTVSDLVIHQQQMAAAKTMQELDALPRRADLEEDIERRLQSLGALIAETDQSVDIVDELRTSFQEVSQIYRRLTELKRDIMDLREQLASRTAAIERIEVDIRHSVEAIAGQINLSASRQRKAIRELLRVPDDTRDRLDDLVRDALLGNQASIQKASSEVQYGVLAVVSEARGLTQANDPDILVDLRDNRIGPQATLIHSALDSLENSLAGHGELLALTRHLRRQFSELLALAVQAEDSVYRLQLRTLPLEQELQALQSESARVLRDMTFILSRLSLATSRVSQGATETSQRVSELSRTLVVGVSVVLLLTLMTLVAVIGRRISGPLDTVRGAMRDISHGNLSRRLDENTGVRDEFAELAVDFNRAAGKTQALINDLAQAMARIEVNEARIRAILDGVPEGVITLTAEGVIQSTNPAAERIFGATPDLLIGRSLGELLSAGAYEALAPLIKFDSAEMGVEQMAGREFLGRRLDGELFPMWMSINVSFAGDRYLYVGIVSDITAFREAEEARHKSEALFRTLYENAPVMIAGFDTEGRCVLWNRELERNLGYGMEEVASDRRIIDRIYPNPAERVEVLNFLKARDGVFREFSPTAKNGARQTHLWANFILGDGTVVSTGYDITGRKKTEEQLKRATSELETILENALVGIAHVHHGRLLRVNRKLMELFGWTSELAQQADVARLFRDPAVLRDFEHESVYSGELEMHKADGSVFWCALSVKAISEHRPERGSIWLFEDVTLRRMTEQQLRYMANYDLLTHLPNRSLFQDRLQHAMLGAARAERKLALLFLDLDHFKHVNDSLGHGAGDQLLCEVARRLTQCIRQNDTVARLGGDEFTILLEDIDSSHDAAGVADKIIDMLAQPYALDAHEVNISPSIGISIFPDDGDAVESLLRNADAAMYHAKACGRNTYQFYANDMNAAATERLQISVSLRKALENDAFVLLYQPLVDVQTGEVDGFEALIRWQHPEWGLVTPDRFVHILEETGLIVPVGEWVLRRACEDCRDLMASEVGVAVNLSGRQFQDGTLPDKVAAILAETGIAPSRLELEITETILMEDSERAIDMLTRLHDLGVRLSVDDFGTGYSSLAYLKRFPIDCVKIDRSFVRDITTDENDAAMVEAILAMTRRLKLDVVAEGVETEEQLAFIGGLQCQRAQGYYFSRPLAAQDVRTFLVGTGHPSVHVIPHPRARKGGARKRRAGND